MLNEQDDNAEPLINTSLMKRDTIALGMQDPVAFTVRQSTLSMRHLADTLYADKFMAIARETLCNAWDAHCDAGTTDTPIKITISSEKQLLTIRDYGTGIAPDNIEVITEYWGSTKTQKRNRTGHFGIGSKCGFSYCDSLTLTSYWNGQKTVYPWYVAADGQIMSAKIVTVPTDEPNGLRFDFPLVNKSDGNRFRETIARFAYSTDMKLDFSFDGRSETFPRLPQAFFDSGIAVDHKNIYSAENDCYCYFVQDNIAYTHKLPADLKFLSCFYIKVPSKTLAYALSREALSYDADTLRRADEILRDVATSIRDELKNLFAAYIDPDAVALNINEFLQHPGLKDEVRPYLERQTLAAAQPRQCVLLALALYIRQSDAFKLEAKKWLDQRLQVLCPQQTDDKNHVPQLQMSRIDERKKIIAKALHDSHIEAFSFKAASAMIKMITPQAFAKNLDYGLDRITYKLDLCDPNDPNTKAPIHLPMLRLGGIRPYKTGKDPESPYAAYRPLILIFDTQARASAVLQPDWNDQYNTVDVIIIPRKYTRLMPDGISGAQINVENYEETVEAAARLISRRLGVDCHVMAKLPRQSLARASAPVKPITSEIELHKITLSHEHGMYFRYGETTVTITKPEQASDVKFMIEPMSICGRHMARKLLFVQLMEHFVKAQLTPAFVIAHPKNKEEAALLNSQYGIKTMHGYLTEILQAGCDAPATFMQDFIDLAAYRTKSQGDFIFKLCTKKFLAHYKIDIVTACLLYIAALRDPDEAAARGFVVEAPTSKAGIARALAAIPYNDMLKQKIEKAYPMFEHIHYYRESERDACMQYIDLINLHQPPKPWSIYVPITRPTNDD